MTKLEIDGKRFLPTEHTIVGYVIAGCKQVGNTITELKLEYRQPQKSGEGQKTPTNSAMDAIAKLVEMRDEMCKRSDVNDAVYKWLEVTKEIISILSSQLHHWAIRYAK